MSFQEGIVWIHARYLWSTRAPKGEAGVWPKAMIRFLTLSLPKSGGGALMMNYLTTLCCLSSFICKMGLTPYRV